MTRNIGLPVKELKKKPVENEKNNPFNGLCQYVVKYLKELLSMLRQKEQLLLRENP